MRPEHNSQTAAGTGTTVTLASTKAGFITLPPLAHGLEVYSDNVNTLLDSKSPITWNCIEATVKLSNVRDKPTRFLWSALLAC